MFDMRRVDKDEIRDLLNHSLIRYTHIDHFLKCGIKKCNNQTICIVKSATNYTESMVTSMFPICNFHFKELFGERCEVCKNRENCKILKNESEYIWIKEVN